MNKNNQQTIDGEVQHQEEQNAMASEKIKIDEFFKSEEHRLIFALVFTDTYLRSDLLGITEDLYTDKQLAKAWRNSIIKKIHPDRCHIPGAKEAVEKLNAFYERMTEDDGDNDE